MTTEEQLLHRNVEHLHGPDNVEYDKDELVVVCIVRDGSPYIKSFVDHYLSMGVKHIAFLDNDSSDDTVEKLRGYDKVTLFRTDLSYKAHGETTGNGWTREVLFKQYIVKRFGKKDRWCLCVDIDELFDYPYSDIVGLGSLLQYLNSKSYTAVAAQMLDMFPAEPLEERAKSQDEPLKERHKFYDISNIQRSLMRDRPHLERNTFGSAEMESSHGGIRDTIFGTFPYLTKFPLVFLDDKTRPLDRSAHRVGNAHIAYFTGVLFHYKFLDEHFHKQVAQAVSEEHRIRNSAKYKIYQKILDENPLLEVQQETSEEISHVNDLLEKQFVEISDDYVAWANTEDERILERKSHDEPENLARALVDSRRRERLKTLSVQQLNRKLRNERLRADSNDAETQLSRKADSQSAAEIWSLHEPSNIQSRQDAPEQAAEGSGKVFANSERTNGWVRPLFVGGCARSGTTAFADYLNQHEEIMLCQERYKGRQRKVSWDLFSFERIMDFRPEETEKPPLGLSVEAFIERHAQLLASKDPAKLKWVGDKGPFYVRSMELLVERNPGARFIMLYRPLEEVAESWEARANNPEDPWLSERGYEKSVETWNQAMRGMRKFADASPAPRMLIISYHDFFSSNETVMPQISRFLGMDFDESVVNHWSEASARFEDSRREKKRLSQEQLSYLNLHADRAAENWVLERLQDQWTDTSLYVQEEAVDTTASQDLMEARMWRLRRKMEELKLELEGERRKNQRSNKALRDLQESKSWKLLQRLDLIRARILPGRSPKT